MESIQSALMRALDKPEHLKWGKPRIVVSGNVMTITGAAFFRPGMIRLLTELHNMAARMLPPGPTYTNCPSTPTKSKTTSRHNSSPPPPPVKSREPKKEDEPAIRISSPPPPPVKTREPKEEHVHAIWISSLVMSKCYFDDTANDLLPCLFRGTAQLHKLKLVHCVFRHEIDAEFRLPAAHLLPEEKINVFPFDPTPHLKKIHMDCTYIPGIFWDRVLMCILRDDGTVVSPALESISLSTSAGHVTGERSRAASEAAIALTRAVLKRAEMGLAFPPLSLNLRLASQFHTALLSEMVLNCQFLKQLKLFPHMSANQHLPEPNIKDILKSLARNDSLEVFYLSTWEFGVSETDALAEALPRLKKLKDLHIQVIDDTCGRRLYPDQDLCDRFYRGLEANQSLQFIDMQVGAYPFRGDVLFRMARKAIRSILYVRKDGREPPLFPDIMRGILNWHQNYVLRLKPCRLVTDVLVSAMFYAMRKAPGLFLEYCSTHEDRFNAVSTDNGNKRRSSNHVVFRRETKSRRICPDDISTCVVVNGISYL